MTRLRRATHVLLLLADALAPVTSPYIAALTRSDPARVRELLGQLSKAQFTRSKLGPGGGAVLLRPPEQITLGEIYLATAAGEPGVIDHAIARSLATVTLADVRVCLRGLQRRARQSPR